MITKSVVHKASRDYKSQHNTSVADKFALNKRMFKIVSDSIKFHLNMVEIN